MNKETALQVMKEAFAKLSLEHKVNLRWHAKQGTTILCQERSNSYFDVNAA